MSAGSQAPIGPRRPDTVCGPPHRRRDEHLQAQATVLRVTIDADRTSQTQWRRSLQKQARALCGTGGQGELPGNVGGAAGGPRGICEVLFLALEAGHQHGQLMETHFRCPAWCCDEKVLLDTRTVQTPLGNRPIDSTRVQSCSVRRPDTQVHRCTLTLCPQTCACTHVCTHTYTHTYTLACTHTCP